MLMGALIGRLFGSMLKQIYIAYPTAGLFAQCPTGVDVSGPSACISPAIYSIVGAGAALTGITRLTVSISVIMYGARTSKWGCGGWGL
jgi:chloride channel 3/4/5